MVNGYLSESRRLIADVTASVRNRSIVTLMYHSVSDDPRDEFAVSPELFQRHINEIVTSGLPIISSSRLLAVIRGDLPIVRSVCITFDDGFDDFAHIAIPILTAYSLPATLFVSTGLIGTTATWPAWSGPRRFLDWAELQNLAATGVEIGSHARSHKRLSSLTIENMTTELGQSREELSDRLRRYLNVIAYPYGDHSPQVREQARAAGYEAAYGVGGLWGNRRGTDLFALRRIAVTSTTAPEQLASIVSGRDDWYRVLRKFSSSLG